MNQFQSDILELHFKKDSTGRTAYFPMGSLKHGYIIPDDEKKNEIKKILAKYEMSFFPLLFLNYSIKLSILSILATIFYFIFTASNCIKEINKATIGLQKAEDINEFTKNEPPKKVIYITSVFLFFTFIWMAMPIIFKIFGIKAIIAFIFFHILLIILTIFVLYNSINNKK